MFEKPHLTTASSRSLCERSEKECTLCQAKVSQHCQCPVLDSILFFIAFKVSCVSRAIFLLMMKFINQTINFELE